MMHLSVNISLEDALDSGWKILAECFNPDETGFRSGLVEKYWPGEKTKSTEKSKTEKTEEDIKPDSSSKEEVKKDKKPKEVSEKKKENKKAKKENSKPKK